MTVLARSRLKSQLTVNLTFPLNPGSALLQAAYPTSGLSEKRLEATIRGPRQSIVLRYSEIVSRAGRDSATPEDLADFQRALTDRYHPNFVDEPTLTSSNFEMCQGDDEPLCAYHTRVVSLLRQAGGRDKPSGDDTPLSTSEKYILNDFIQRFIQGLADKSLMQEAINQNVLAADTLKSAFERIRQAGCIQHAKTELARAVARDTKISLYHHPMACLCYQLGARD
ncbi:hypothetical protein E4U40_006387 [Claviceps sp. LM458 group G5]|nr:hypothetical protein E4U40_006387 [Claviceps sp. LM458 group G5]